MFSAPNKILTVEYWYQIFQFPGREKFVNFLHSTNENIKYASNLKAQCSFDFACYSTKQDSDIVASSTCSSLQSTAVKRKLSDTHDEQSQNTDEETVETPSTEPHTTLIDSGIARNVPNKPAQETLMKKIGLLQQRINILTEARDTGIAKDDVHNEIKKLRKELKEDEKSLKKKRDSAKRAKKFRAKEKLEKNERHRNNPAAALPRTDPGQPSLVDTQLALLETIINIAIHGSAADERRRTEMIRSCLTLSDLHERLMLMGFQILEAAHIFTCSHAVLTREEGTYIPYP
ncbi:hypothetical protein EVAR_25965_1 [Eumeta japonica]|uniref:Uncharacterized protein n=1 Tax=Eumeta variegata TaxID=151549 RepID=A0A4C1V307_EUMVA|nr:hypothetical protein EVAR_25965_1 [Eumeta japonica]